jgi:predicted PurR-regulated permease PerM
MDTLKLPFYARLALILLALVLTCFILRMGENIFIPLVFGLLISILLYPLNKFFENKLHLGRGLSPLLCIILFISAMVSFIYFLAVQIIGFSSDFPKLRVRFMQMTSSLQHWLSYKLHINNSKQTDYINNATNGILGSVGHSLSNFFVSVTGILLLTVFVLIFTFFMLYYRKLLIKFVLFLFKSEHQVKVKEVIMETKSMIYSYVFGLLIEMAVLSVVNSIMFMVIGIQYALLLGVMSAVLNIIPYLGIYTSIVITVIVTLANSTGNMALEAGAGLFIIHLLDSNILFPRIVGGRVKMNPFITIIAVIVGEFLWGIPGMFLFIPITGIIKLICERVEGLETWSLLIGVEEADKKPVKTTSIKGPVEKS